MGDRRHDLRELIRDPTSSEGADGLSQIFNIYRVVCIGPVCYSVVSESSSTRLRNKTVALARLTYQLTGIVAGVLTPYMLVSRHQYLCGASLIHERRILPPGVGRARQVGRMDLTATSADRINRLLLGTPLLLDLPMGILPTSGIQRYASQALADDSHATY